MKNYSSLPVAPDRIPYPIVYFLCGKNMINWVRTAIISFHLNMNAFPSCRDYLPQSLLIILRHIYTVIRSPFNVLGHQSIQNAYPLKLFHNRIRCQKIAENLSLSKKKNKANFSPANFLNNILTIYTNLSKDSLSSVLNNMPAVLKCLWAKTHRLLVGS